MAFMITSDSIEAWTDHIKVKRKKKYKVRHEANITLPM